MYNHGPYLQIGASYIRIADYIQIVEGIFFPQKLVL